MWGTTLHEYYTTTTLQYTTIFFTTVHYTSYTTLQLQLQVRLQLQLHYTNCIALQLLLHYTDYNYNYNCTTPHYIQQLWLRYCNHSKTTFRSSSGFALIHASRQLTSPIVSYLWKFRHRLVEHYWQERIEFLMIFIDSPKGVKNFKLCYHCCRMVPAPCALTLTRTASSLRGLCCRWRCSTAFEFLGLNFVPTLPFVNPTRRHTPNGLSETNLPLTCIAICLDFVDGWVGPRLMFQVL